MSNTTGNSGPQGLLSEVRFLTVAEVAELMRVSKMTVYRLVHSGQLGAVRVGRSFRVPEQAVQEYLRSGLPAGFPDVALRLAVGMVERLHTTSSY
ncbi:helix-turn-helix domain-containing protein [Phytomonospora sp. NPDC050363]|uniref:helix-turn-helix domain-containing protein n=1 Tax=Phytomonospora sp. NPDC050363 TaxID=3155642 RepID=UPI0033FD6E1F